MGYLPLEHGELDLSSKPMSWHRFRAGDLIDTAGEGQCWHSQPRSKI
jgi:hypothetical protein